MKDLQKLADTIVEMQEDGQLEIFIGDFSSGFEVGVDDKGVYLSLCPHCVGEAVSASLGAEEEATPSHKELH